jgi:hypothetical protein
MRPRKLALFVTAFCSMCGVFAALIPPKIYAAGIRQGSLANVGGAFACDCTAPTQACGCVFS